MNVFPITHVCEIRKVLGEIPNFFLNKREK